MQGSRTRVARLVVCSANYALIVLLLTDYFHRREVCWKVATRKPESSQVCNRNNTTVFEIFVTLWRGCLVQKNRGFLLKLTLLFKNWKRPIPKGGW